jgi:hypothetical protein
MHRINLPVTPGAIIGYRKNGTPIRLIAGGSGEGDEGGGTTEGQEGNAGNSGGDAGQTDSTDGQEPPEGASSGDGADTSADDKTTRTVAAIRQEFKDERAKRQAAEREVASIKAALEADKAERTKQMDALAIALGLKSGDEPPDPVKLAAELKAAQEKAAAEISQRDAAIRTSQVELAVLRNAGRHGGNGDALLDSRSFMAKVNGLDPSADDFADQLGDAIKAAVESSPQYKATAAPPAGGNGDGNGGGQKPPATPARSGGEHTTPGGNRQWTIEDVRAVRTANDPSTAAKLIDEAVNSGFLSELGYQPSKNRR